MNKSVLSFVVIAVFFALNVSNAKIEKSKDRKPNQTVDFDRSKLSRPERIAQALATGKFSCQREHEIVQELLSSTPLNLPVVEMARDLYNKCVSAVANAVGVVKSSPDDILNTLVTDKLICPIEIDKLQDALSNLPLDLGLIQKLKANFESCRGGAKAEIIKNNQ